MWFSVFLKWKTSNVQTGNIPEDTPHPEDTPRPVVAAPFTS